MEMSEIVAILSTCFGAILVYIGLESTRVYDYTVGCTSSFDASPVIPEYFIIVGLIFVVIGAGVHLLSGIRQRNNGRCPYCGQPIQEMGEDGG